MNFLFSPTFDFIVAGIVLVLAVVFFMGKGGKVLSLFDGTSGTYENMAKKQTPEQNLHYQRTMSLFLLVLGVMELVLGLVGTSYAWVGWASIAVVVLDFVWLIWYLNRHFPKK